jgi:uncharacterized protein
MIAELHSRRPEIAALCKRFGVKRLDIFGSAVDPAEFDSQTSDLDLLVEFNPSHDLGPADQYFGLLDELRSLLGREIDLVTARSLRNPYFIRSVNRTRQVLYAS